MINKFLAILVVVGLLGACTPKAGTVIKETLPKDVNAFRKMPPTPGPAPVIQLGDYETFTLSNGLKIILVEDHHTPAITFSLSIDQPPFFEKEKAGYAELAGDLLAHGTKTRTKAQIDESVDFIGANLSAHSRGVYGNSLTKHKDVLLSLMSDVLLNPSFPEKELEKLKKQKLSNLAQEKDDADAIANNVGGVLNFGKKHPYGEIVTEKTVEKITRQDCVDFYKTFFRPNISYLVVTGDMTLSELKPLAKKYFGGWKKGAIPVIEMPVVDAPKESSIALVNKPEAVQSRILVTYPLDMKPDSPDRIKARVANALLGGFFGSRLNKNLREDKAYTYGARSAISVDRDVASFRGGAKVRNMVTDSSIIQIMYEMNRLRTEKPGDDELKRVKSVLSGQFARSMENKSTIAQFALSMMKYGLPKDYYATYLKKLNAVTADDVLAMSKKYIQPDKAYIVVVGNQEDIVDKLKAIAPKGGVQLFDIQGSKLKAPKRSIAGMSAEKVIEKYVEAIGGKDAVAKIKNITIVTEGQVQGQSLTVTVVSTTNNQSKVVVKMGGQVMQKIVYSNNTGYQEMMGKRAPLGDAEIAEFKEKIPFIESRYTELGYKLVLKSVENVDGAEAYKVIAENPQGKKTISYFDAASGLKLQEVEEGKGGTIVTKLANYKKVNGLMVPYTVTQTGIGPGPMVLQVIDIKMNSVLGAKAFE